jgi:hypothetical protein
MPDYTVDTIDGGNVSKSDVPGQPAELSPIEPARTPKVQRDARGYLLKGSVLNPTGRKTVSLPATIRHFLREKDPNDKLGRTRLQILILATYREALNGNTRAVELLHDRGFGKTPDRLISDTVEGWGVLTDDEEDIPDGSEIEIPEGPAE